jgi:tetratricopeptide (TPR) repeat protein
MALANALLLRQQTPEPAIFNLPPAEQALICVFVIACLWVLWVTCIRTSKAMLLGRKGRLAAQLGQHAEAVRYFREALASKPAPTPVEQRLLLMALAIELVEHGCYREAREPLKSALASKVGDLGGICHAAMAELLLLQGIELEKAIELVDEAMELARVRGRWGGLSRKMCQRLDGSIRAGMWAQKAWALAQLGRNGEARQALEMAVKSVEDVLRLGPYTVKEQTDDLLTFLRNHYLGLFYAPAIISGLAEAHWRIGMVWLALHETANAMTHFSAARDQEPEGKYGILSQQQLKQLAEVGGP